MSQAFAERSHTDDPKAKIVPQSAVGVLIASREYEIARSANIFPPGILFGFKASGRKITDDERYHLIEHAERAAIFKAFLAKEDMSNATIYCTRFPCSDCARAIIWAGIKRAVFAGGFAGETRWLASQRAALRILRDGGVKVRYISGRVNQRTD